MKLLAGVIAALCVAGVAYADDQKALWDYARKYEGRFATEIPAAGATFKLRFKSDSADFVLVKYLPKEQYFVDTSPPTVAWKILALNCKAAGSYVGRTAMGATANVSRRICQQLVIDDPGGGVPLGRDVCISSDPTAKEVEEADTAECGQRRRTMWAKMTPDQFRALKSGGAIFEITFEAGQDVNDEVVVREASRHAPTLSVPYEMLIDSHTVRGKITSVRLTLPGGHVEQSEVAK